MITGIIALLGALAGFAPAIVQLLTLKANNAHELAMVTLRLQAEKEGKALEIDRTRVEADVRQADHIYNFASQPSGYKFIDALVVSVRPVITYSVFAMWAFLKLCLTIYAVNKGYDLGQLVRLLWDENEASIYAAIIGFWFGNRMMVRGQQVTAATEAVTRGRT